ncbi:MAG: 30S ribosomal protein S27ae [Nanoarchaeota archaeon]|nr:30S ribosomal protein S27ae [Nanoarchaeota archaeon]|tara:strand:- start:1105 stop:1359 length:255 start_codon:yes stop_codon:yes gene_type:complete
MADEKKSKGRTLHTLYEVSGDSVTRKNTTCPKCGPGMFMGKHKDRVVCGKCGYLEMNKPAEKKEEKPSEVKEESSESKKEENSE